jgi:hypothetical protein
VRESIENLFGLLDCDYDKHAQVLGQKGVTESNLMSYLGIIEQRMTEVLQVYNILQVRFRNS